MKDPAFSFESETSTVIVWEPVRKLSLPLHDPCSHIKKEKAVNVLLSDDSVPNNSLHGISGTS